MSEYKKKYLKYKRKYLFIRNIQHGGIHTNEILERNLKTDELTQHDIRCPENQILKQYQLRRTHQEPRHTYYSYECENNQILDSDNFELPTELNEYGDGKTIYLDRHNIECPPTYALSRIKLNKEGEQINYDYTCNNANLHDITQHETPLNDDGGRNSPIIYLDRHNIKCPDGKYLNSVQLRRGKDDNNNLTKYKFIYKCGTMPILVPTPAAAVPTPAATTSQITQDRIIKWSKKVDGKNGHIIAKIQEDILGGHGYKSTTLYQDIIKIPELKQKLKDFITTIRDIINSKNIGKLDELKNTINKLLEFGNKINNLKGNDNVIYLNKILTTIDINEIDKLWKNMDLNNLERIFITRNSPHTQSHVWCPLIWCALQRNGYDVPDEWCVIRFNNPNFEREFNKEIDVLAANKSWVVHAQKILLN